MSTPQTVATKVTNWREFERQNPDIKNATHLKVPLDRIKKKKGFNPRDLNKPETLEKIAGMKHSYLTGKFVPMISVSLNGDHLEIVDGECRYTAATQADKDMRDQGLPGLQFLEVVPFKGNDKERLVATILANEGEKLTPLEQAEVVRRLLAMGLNREQVAEEIFKSIGWVDRLIVIAKLPEVVKKQIREGTVSTEVAVKMVKLHGEEGAQGAIADKLRGVTAHPLGEKKAKVTAKHVQPADKKEKAAVKLEGKQFHTARDIAFAMPEKMDVPKVLKPKELYTVELPGSVIQNLLNLQKQFTE